MRKQDSEENREQTARINAEITAAYEKRHQGLQRQQTAAEANVLRWREKQNESGAVRKLWYAQQELVYIIQAKEQARNSVLFVSLLGRQEGRKVGM